ncbi:MAG: hypothetical protein CVV64_08865 [Candidatus Wallbacteria bacterium HGW-Wallbacteria-1]|jgi:hypothetical protein|uniref:DUF3006 domain-containing protein n=1 Tax=Candidatus Wallbacteria bacterium HGW-Wallbacteria-1 TaxID=2013854 RepID=A0A2N1PQ50_9BACT|nr:MAG: hypothetical protein CVV64_08865 [Candidatus Wallbacteria bacterium HGW-Wallbacteria-1]
MKSKTPEKSSFKVIIDRFEGDERVYAVLEMPDLDHILVPAEYLPQDSGEGDCLIVTMTTDREDTLRRMEETRKMQEEMMKG